MGGRHRRFALLVPDVLWRRVQRAQLLELAARPRRAGRRLRHGQRQGLLLGEEQLGRVVGLERLHQDDPRLVQPMRNFDFSELSIRLGFRATQKKKIPKTKKKKKKKKKILRVDSTA